MPHRGLLLINLGTPAQPDAPAVRAYLEEFLMDPYVVDVPYALRWMLVHGIILRNRPEKSAAAYRKIWSQGSPLLHYLQELVARVKVLMPEWSVRGAMRYGQPSLENAISEFREEGVRDLTMFPMYPQYSLAATESSVQECRRILARPENASLRAQFLGPFYDHPAFIRSFVERAQGVLQHYQYDHVLMSFHGLPVRQVKKVSPAQSYLAQSYQTARQIAQGLGLGEDRYTVCFQSRLGVTPWLRPFTDHMYRELPRKGVKKLAVICPAFVADCLETLEEIQIRGKADFLKQGGEDLRLVPSLNASETWAQAVSEIVGD